jgi:chorismate mutase
MTPLDSFRTQINELDRNIFTLLEKRFTLMPGIGAAKKIAELPIDHPTREAQLVTNAIETYPAIPKEFIEQYYEILFRESKKLQK